MIELYLIWSHEHSAWWGKDRCGYVRILRDAVLSEGVVVITTPSAAGTSLQLGALPELPVMETHIRWMHERFRSELPYIEHEPWEPHTQGDAP